jgi:hypothetical protein
MWGLGGVLVMAGMWWILASPTPQTGSADKKDDPKAIKISTDDMVNRSMADKEWMALSENQLRRRATRSRRCKAIPSGSTSSKADRGFAGSEPGAQDRWIEGALGLSDRERPASLADFGALDPDAARHRRAERALWHRRTAHLSAGVVHPQWFAADATIR